MGSSLRSPRARSSTRACLQTSLFRYMKCLHCSSYHQKACSICAPHLMMEHSIRLLSPGLRHSVHPGLGQGLIYD